MEKLTTKRMALYSGRTHPALAAGGGRPPRHRARATRTSSSSPTARSARASPRASAAATCSSCRPTTACDGRSDQRLDHGAADHDRRRLPGVGQADHRRLPVLRLRPPGPQGRGPRADHRPAGRRHVQGRRRQADGLDRPAQRPDPGLLRRPGRPPHGDAGARGLRPQARRRTPVIVSPDAGRIKVAERMAQHLDDKGADLAFIYKRRPKGTANVVEAKEVIGDVDGRLCILTDDMIDSGGTICSRRRAPARRAAPPRCGRWPPTACSAARPSTG